MYTLVVAVHVVLAIALVGLVLLQQGKGADVGAVMGGGGANSIFGVGGASSVLVRATTGIAILFMLTSVLLVKFASGAGVRSVPTDVLEGMDLGAITPQDSSSKAASSVVQGTPSLIAAAPSSVPSGAPTGVAGKAAVAKSSAAAASASKVVASTPVPAKAVSKK
jgi:preprotein translocase subunit SecG